MRKLSYIQHIDSLRAIAVLLVILFHLDVALFKGGFLGVDIFFVISGFLITRLLNYEIIETGSVSFKNFYVRRARRLMPTLFLTIFLTFSLAFLAFSPSDFINVTKSMFMSSIALSNFYFLGESGYFDNTSQFKPLLHTWSLGIEEQFYLLFPITLFLLIKLFSKRRNGVTISLIILFLLSFSFNIYSSVYGISDKVSSVFVSEDNLSSSISSLQFYLIPFRMFEFLVGAIIVLIKAPEVKSEYSKLMFNLVGLFIIIGSSLLLSKNTMYLSSLNLVPCLGTGILLFFPPSKYLSFIFNNEFLRDIGKKSYTLYLIHWPLIVVYRYIFDSELIFVEQIGLFIAIYILSSIIYKYFETPLRYTEGKFAFKSNMTLLLTLVINILIVITIKIKVNTEDGWLWRLSKKNLSLIEEIGVPKDYHKKNWGAAGYNNTWVGPGQDYSIEPDMYWIGDSHSAHFMYGLDSIMVKKNKKVIYHYDYFSSLKLPDIIRNDKDGYFTKSKDAFKEALSRLKKRKNSTIVLSHYWTAQLKNAEYFDSMDSTYKKFPEGSAGFKVLASKIEQLHELIGKNRKIIIIGETPSIKGAKLNYIEKLLRPKYIAMFAETSATFRNESKNSEINTYFEKYFRGSNNIVFINPEGAFCKDETCLKQKNDEIYFTDSSHLSQTGSLHCVKYMESLLLNAI